jgi:predicted nicotinamide N-methyase
MASMPSTWRIIMTGSPPPRPAAPEILRTGTTLRPVPLVPEIRLYQAEDPVGLWERIELTSGEADQDPPFWAFAWAGGQALARYLLDHPETVRGRHVIDIASGSGLVAIAAAQAGAATVTAYDIDPLAVASIEVNAEANTVVVQAVCADIVDDDAPVDDDPPRDTGDPRDDAAVVLVADAFYQRELATKVTWFIEQAHARGAAVLAGDFGRAYLPRDRLTPLASYDVSGLNVLEDSDVKSTTIWTLAPWPD